MKPIIDSMAVESVVRGLLDLSVSFVAIFDKPYYYCDTYDDYYAYEEEDVILMSSFYARFSLSNASRASV
jgi:hypothetical protein